MIDSINQPIKLNVYITNNKIIKSSFCMKLDLDELSGSLYLVSLFLVNPNINNQKNNFM